MADQITLAEILATPIAIVGAGVTGRSVADFLTSRGASFTLFDERLAQGVEQELGDRKFAWAVVSPGWKREHQLLSELQVSGARLISEIDFAWLIKSESNPTQRWIALTGTNGKTTTVQMVESIFAAAGIRGRACGNVGNSVVQTLMADPTLDYLALELSSFQIEWSGLPTFEAVAILNIAEDHIDWHGGFDAYANAKLKLLHQTDVAILNALDSEVVNRSLSWNGRRVLFTLETPRQGELGLVENLLVDRAFVATPDLAESFAELNEIQPSVPHNVLNAMAAAGLALALGVTHEQVNAGLRNFKLDHHRLELVAERNEIRWINDSKATNPHAARAALSSVESCIWIAGGLAKGATMHELVRSTKKRIRAAILIGEDRELIAQAFAEHAPEIPYFRVDGGSAEELMRAVVEKAAELAQPGDAVLLAPACASMDQFSSYAHRGDTFREAVEELLS